MSISNIKNKLQEVAGSRPSENKHLTTVEKGEQKGELITSKKGWFQPLGDALVKMRIIGKEKYGKWFLNAADLAANEKIEGMRSTRLTERGISLLGKRSVIDSAKATKVLKKLDEDARYTESTKQHTQVKKELENLKNPRQQNFEQLKAKYASQDGEAQKTLSPLKKSIEEKEETYKNLLLQAKELSVKGFDETRIKPEDIDITKVFATPLENLKKCEIDPPEKKTQSTPVQKTPEDIKKEATSKAKQSLLEILKIVKSPNHYLLLNKDKMWTRKEDAKLATTLSMALGFKWHPEQQEQIKKILTNAGVPEKEATKFSQKPLDEARCQKLIYLIQDQDKYNKEQEEIKQNQKEIETIEEHFKTATEQLQTAFTNKKNELEEIDNNLDTKISELQEKIQQAKVNQFTQKFTELEKNFNLEKAKYTTTDGENQKALLQSQKDVTEAENTYNKTLEEAEKLQEDNQGLKTLVEKPIEHTGINIVDCFNVKAPEKPETETIKDFEHATKNIEEQFKKATEQLQTAFTNKKNELVDAKTKFEDGSKKLTEGIKVAKEEKEKQLKSEIEKKNKEIEESKKKDENLKIEQEKAESEKKLKLEKEKKETELKEKQKLKVEQKNVENQPNLKKSEDPKTKQQSTGIGGLFGKGIKLAGNIAGAIFGGDKNGPDNNDLPTTITK